MATLTAENSTAAQPQEVETLPREDWLPEESEAQFPGQPAPAVPLPQVKAARPIGGRYDAARVNTGTASDPKFEIVPALVEEKAGFVSRQVHSLLDLAFRLGFGGPGNLWYRDPRNLAGTAGSSQLSAQFCIASTTCLRARPLGVNEYSTATGRWASTRRSTIPAPSNSWSLWDNKRSLRPATYAEISENRLRSPMMPRRIRQVHFLPRISMARSYLGHGSWQSIAFLSSPEGLCKYSN